MNQNRYRVYNQDEDRMEEVKVTFPTGMSHSVDLDLVRKVAEKNPTNAIQMLVAYLKVIEHLKEQGVPWIKKGVNNE